MKNDLDRLMSERDLDAFVVTGPSVNNPVMYYMVNGAKVGEGTMLVKKRGEAPSLLVNGMERDEAAKSGLALVDWSKYDRRKILEEEGGNHLRASVRTWERVFSDLGVHGKVALYGLAEQGPAIRRALEFNARGNGTQLTGEFFPTIFESAWVSKDPEEVERIRRVGEKTMQVVGNTAEFLQAHRASNDVLVKGDGSPLTVGDVKREMRRWFTEVDLEDPDGVIFAIGRDAGVPHSSGEEADPIALGKTIVFDIFPREPGGGYFFDFTRTWCLGYAPPEVEKAYRDVMDTFDTVMSEMKMGEECRPYQQRTCELLEARGHPTVGQDPKITEGYVHSLGHGVGLNIHEPPYFSDHEGNTDTMPGGCVVTIEPGVYYPDSGGYGIRIEDCVWKNPRTGHFEALADYSKEFVLPVRDA